jgi:transcriptional regulator with XRE-family HTH domain
MVKNKQSLGKVLKREREKKGLSAYKLCKLADVDTSYYSKIENKNKLPGLKTMVKIANVLEEESLLYEYVDEKYPELDKIYKIIDSIHDKKPLARRYMTEDKLFRLATIPPNFKPKGKPISIRLNIESRIEENLNVHPSNKVVDDIHALIKEIRKYYLDIKKIVKKLQKDKK